jgi:AcrR family transcriptional regulator
VSTLRQRLLDAAEACYLDHGRQRTSIADIAHRARVSRPTVYKHLGDGDAVAAALVERELDRFAAELEASLDHHTELRDKLIESVAHSVAYARTHTLLQRLLALEPESVLPWFTTHAEPFLARAVKLLAPMLRGDTSTHGAPDADADSEAEALAEWAARLAVSLVVTPSVTSSLTDAASLWAFVEQLLAVGQPKPATLA